MPHQARHHEKSSSRTWIVGCFAAALVGLISALAEAPFHQTSAIELGVVSGICLTLGLIGWRAAAPRSHARPYAATVSQRVAERSLQSVGASAE